MIDTASRSAAECEPPPGSLSDSYFTRVPNEITDWLLPDLTPAALKVFLYVCRRTYGFGKEWDEISLSQFSAGITKRSGERLDRGTGLSRQGVLNGIGELKRLGLLFVRRKGRGRSHKCEYAIGLEANAKARLAQYKSEMVNRMDRRSGETNGQRRVHQVVNSRDHCSPGKVQGVDTQKRSSMKERKLIQEIPPCTPPFCSTPKNTKPSAGEWEAAEMLPELVRRELGAYVSARDHARIEELCRTFPPNHLREALAEFTTQPQTYEASDKARAFLQFVRKWRRDPDFGDE